MKLNLRVLRQRAENGQIPTDKYAEIEAHFGTGAPASTYVDGEPRTLRDILRNESVGSVTETLG